MDINMANTLTWMQRNLNNDIFNLNNLIYENPDDAPKIKILACLYDLQECTFYWEDLHQKIDVIGSTAISFESIEIESMKFYLMQELWEKKFEKQNRGNGFSFEKMEKISDRYYLGLLGLFSNSNNHAHDVYSTFIKKMSKYSAYRMTIYYHHYFKNINVPVAVSPPSFSDILDRGFHKVEYLSNKPLPLSLLEAISRERYENAENEGTMVFIQSDLYKSQILFSEIILFTSNNMRKIRKLVEMTDSTYALIVKYSKDQTTEITASIANEPNCSMKVVGLGRIPKQANYIVEFKGFMRFLVRTGAEKVLEYRHGKYAIPQQERRLSKKHQETLINKLNDLYSEEIMTVILASIKQPHGTLLIISNNAKSEAMRLCKKNRGFAISASDDTPVNLLDDNNKELIRKITSIDGAIMLDEKGNCYAVGVILDGEAIVEGDSSRGARYNSAINYIKVKEEENKKAKQKNMYIAVIVSEDGSVDIE